MKFSDTPAHDFAKQRLKAFVDINKIPHAILLEGPCGIGKFALARAFAQYIHCQNRINGDSCGKCPSCLQHESYNHIDTHFVFPVVKKSSPKKSFSDDYIDVWKDYLSENPYMDFQKWLVALDNVNAQPAIYVDESEELIRKLNFTSHQAKYKVVLFWLPERMNQECANKLLKLIEEPYGDTLFVFVSNNSREILPTIYSRTQRIELKRLSDEVIAQYLVDNYAVEAQDALALAHIADGNIIEADKMVSLSKENQRFFELFIQLMRLSYQRKVKELKSWSVDVAGLGREQIMRFLTYIQRLIRENFIYNLSVSELNYLNREEAQFSQNFARFITENNVIKLIDVLNKALTDISGNANAKIVLYDMSIKVILLLKA
ncbi:MAG: DNA polymerase III subunit delta' [Muribaculaceae bacterium]|nr:DNA polymerase III subunit delta' [Muribaculaceae bacterium]